MSIETTTAPAQGPNGEGVHPAGTGETLLMEGGSPNFLRLLSIVALTFAVGSLVLAAMLVDNRIGLGNNFSSTERAVWAGGLLLLLVGFSAAVGLYRRRVASRITLLSDGEHVRIETASLFGKSLTDVNVGDVVLSRYHEGDKAGEQSMNTPWLHVQVRNQRSFVVPLTGYIPSKERLLKVLGATR